MKKLFYLIIIAFVANSCASKTEEEKKSCKELAKDLHGIWVNNAYLEGIKTSKSPFKTLNASPYSVVQIDSTNSLDSILVIEELNYPNTTFDYKLHFVKGDKDNEYKFLKAKEGESDVSKNIFCKNSCPLITNVSKNQITILENGKERTYSKVDLKKDEYGVFEVAQFTTSLILKGNYSLKDTGGKVINDNLVIEDNGNISGFEGFKKAELLHHFVDHSKGIKTDLMEFIPASANSRPDLKEENCFAYSIKENNIELREVTFSPKASFANFEIGELKYILEKK